MNATTFDALAIAQGPLFRFAIALALLGLGRAALLSLSDLVGGYVTAADRAEFWRKVRIRLTWLLLPIVVLRRANGFSGPHQYAYHVALSGVGLLFRFGVIITPLFMVAHASLLERGLGLGWPFLPGTVADALTLVTIVAGFVLFLGRLYSPVLRSIEPAWAFLKPLILLLPFLTGVFAMHPTWTAFQYRTMMLLHVLSAVLVLALLPFARLLSILHSPLTRVYPPAAWNEERAARPGGLSMARSS